MENTPLGGLPSLTFRACPLCRTLNWDWLTYCSHCGAVLPQSEQATQAEIGHIAYLLGQLRWWQSRNLLSRDAAAKLNSEYTERQNRLQGWIGGVHPDVPDALTVAPPVVPPLPVEPRPRDVASPVFPIARPIGLPTYAHTTPVPPSDAPTPDQTRYSVSSQRPASRVHGIAVFLQEHALKIVFALATVLVLVALRSILGWSATNAAFLALTPLLALGLTAMFWQFGRKTQQANPWAAFVYQGLTAFLLGFDLFILNRFWLAAVHVNLPSKLLLFMACCVLTATCAMNWRQHRYQSMWHLVQAGILTTLFSALQGLKQLFWQLVDWRPAPLLLFGLAYLGAATVYFCIATQNALRRDADRAERAEAWNPALILWGNLSIAFAFVLSGLALAFNRGLHSDDLLLVLLMAAVLYGVIAQALESARLVYVAAFLCLGTGLAWVPAHLPLGVLSYGVLFLSLSTIALALHTYNRGMPARRSLAIAWKQVALTANTLALILIGGQTLLALIGTSSLGESHATPLRAGLALMCSLQFVFMAWNEAEASLCYPACLSGGIALLGLLQSLHTAADLYPLALEAYAALLLLLSVGRNGLRLPQASQEDAAPAWCHTVRTSGKIALSIGLAASSVLAVVHSHSLWLVASLLLSGVLCAAIGSRERSRAWVYTALYGGAYAFGLLMLSLVTVPLTFSDCMLPFVLLCAAAAFGASRAQTARDDRPDMTIPRQMDLWREPLFDAGLVALTATLFAAWTQIQQRMAQPYLALDITVCVVAALLLTASRYIATTDGRRVGALVLLNAVTALAIADYTGLAAVGHTVPSAAWHAFVFGMLIQSWAFWLLARALYLFSPSEVWSEDLSHIEMALASLSALLTTIGAVWMDSHASSGSMPPLFLIGGAFTLIHLELHRSRRADLVVLSAGMLLLAGISALLGHDGIQPYPASTLAAFSILATASYLLSARQLKNVWIAGLTWLPLLGGAALALVQFGTLPFGPQDTLLANAIWVIGGLGIAWSYLSAAKWSDQSAFVYASGITLIGAYLRAETWAFHLPHSWDALVLLPLLVCMAALALRPPKGWNLVQRPYLEVAVTASGPALVWPAVCVGGWLGFARDHTPHLATLTLAGYGIAYLALAIVRKTPKSLATAAALLTLAYLHLLLGMTALRSPEHPALSWPLFAFLALQAALVWTGIGAFLKRSSSYPTLATPLLRIAQIVALVSAVNAAWCLYSPPQQGNLCILTLVWAAAIWFGHWTLDQGEFCLHVGTGNLLVAWCVILYHTVGAEIDLLDVYLLPFGFYLLLLGHLISRKQKQKEAQTFWGIGLLVALTPALLTRWMHAPEWHAALLIAECVVCVLWGIAQRIRVFVAAGLGTIVLYAASVLVGSLPDTITTILALLVGVGLFVFGFYALTHQEMMKRLAAEIQQRWTVWHSWR